MKTGRGLILVEIYFFVVFVSGANFVIDDVR
jgi:hypothetical protein